jgi:hypothetical protein
MVEKKLGVGHSIVIEAGIIQGMMVGVIYKYVNCV